MKSTRENCKKVEERCQSLSVDVSFLCNFFSVKNEINFSVLKDSFSSHLRALSESMDRHKNLHTVFKFAKF